MAKKGLRLVRAAWLDATEESAREMLPADPSADVERRGFKPGQWPGFPADGLPPECPVIPLGIDGKTSYFVDTSGQLMSVSASEWGKKMLTQLFALQPNYLQWAWPRISAQTFKVNGLKTDEAQSCLVKAAAARGLFSPQDRVRGRGFWVARDGNLLWHAGDRLYRSERGRLVAQKPGELDGLFYPQRPETLRPWMTPVDAGDAAIVGLLQVLKGWNWERGQLDPLLMLGWMGCSLLGAALPWRPHVFVTGDRGIGKSTLQFVVKAVLGDALHACADTTAAGIYQRVRQDCLPVAIDELEAEADNRKVMAVMKLARLASSGALMYRGGAEHEGVEFRLSNTFLFSSINPPPLDPQDRSRLCILNLQKLKPGQKEVTLKDPDTIGRMMLRALLDRWGEFGRVLGNWKGALHEGGLDARAQDTYGTLMAVAELLLGEVAMEDEGLPITESRKLGEVLASATMSDRAETIDNWRGALEHLLGSQIDAWRTGEKPTVGQVLEAWERGKMDVAEANQRLGLIGLRVQETKFEDGSHELLLAVPSADPLLARVYAGTKWSGGVWNSALKQAPADVVIRDRGNKQVIKINRAARRCLLVDLKEYDRAVAMT